MSSDLTLLYYSANALPDPLATNIRNEIIKVTDNQFPIISVTQKPVDFGKNICVGDIGQSYYNIYKQMYVGIQEVQTKYTAIIEDDSLYVPEHFLNRPSADDIFAYNGYFYFVEKDYYWTRGHHGTFGCIAATALFHEALKQRFDRYQIEPMPREYQKYAWMEFGHEERLAFTPFKTEEFRTKVPLLTWCYYGATFGKPKRHANTSSVATDLEHWGNVMKLRERLGA